MFDAFTMVLGYIVEAVIIGGLILLLIYFYDIFRFNRNTKKVREEIYTSTAFMSELISFAETYKQEDEMSKFINKLYDVSHLNDRILEQFTIYNTIDDMYAYYTDTSSSYNKNLCRIYTVLNKSTYYFMKIFKCINTYKLINLSQHTDDMDKKVQCKNAICDVIDYLDTINRMYSDHLGGDNIHYE